MPGQSARTRVAVIPTGMPYSVPPNLKKLMQFVLRELAITQDLGEQSRTNGFSTVHWDDSDSPVRMAKEMVATTHSHIAESSTLKRIDEFFTRQSRKACHEPIEIF